MASCLYTPLFLMAAVGLANLAAADNFHSSGMVPVICNGEALPVEASGVSRWKVSFLGIEDGISIDEVDGKVFITGIARDVRLVERRVGRTIYFPQSFPIVLHGDIVYNGVPKKVLLMSGFLCLITGLTWSGMTRIEAIFK